MMKYFAVFVVFSVILSACVSEKIEIPVTNNNNNNDTTITDTTTTDTTTVTVCTNQLPYNWNGNDYNAAGTYSDTLTGTAGCDSVATLILTVNEVLTDTTTITICTNQLPYNWNGNDYNAAGTYSDTLTSTAGCDSVVTLILTVNEVLTDTTTINICTNQLPYNWNGNDYNAS